MTARMIVRPFTPEALARLAGSRPAGSPFSAPWSETVDVLRREVTHLGASEFVLMIDVQESDIRLDGAIRATARPATPSAAVAVHSRTKGDLLFTCGRFRNWQHNVRAIALGLEALRKVDRYGITESDEQYRGWQALPPGTPMPGAKMTVEDAKFLLRSWWHGAASEHDDWALLYRRAAKELHPDAGGDPEDFKRLTEARDLLLGAR